MIYLRTDAKMMSVKFVLFPYYVKQVDSMLPCVCTVTDHRRSQKSGTPGIAECVCAVLATF